VSRRRDVLRERVLLEHWARCDGTMANACRWVLRRLSELEREKRDLARMLASRTAELDEGSRE
jgi:hypothetical protein